MGDGYTTSLEQLIGKSTDTLKFSNDHQPNSEAADPQFVDNRKSSSQLLETFQRSYLSSNYEEMTLCADQFINTAANFGKIIIEENGFPNHKKQIKPNVLMGGIAGGEKYIAHDVFFKYAKDKKNGDRWVYGGNAPNDTLATKSANHELLGLANFMAADKKKRFCNPLFAIIDYQGYRLTAMTVLPIESNLNKVYGCSDGGSAVSFNLEVHKELLEIAHELNLAPHLCNAGHEMALCTDIEVHHVEDKYYVIDTARIFPPTYPSPGNNSLLYEILRPEFVSKYKEPLSSDSLSKFHPVSEQIKFDNRILIATKHLLEDLVPQFAKKLTLNISEVNAQYINPSIERLKHPTFNSIYFTDPIIVALHLEGLNMRYLGLVRHYLRQQKDKNKKMKEHLLNILLIRVIKNYWREEIRNEAKNSNNGNSINEISKAVTYRILKILTTDNKEFWENTVVTLLETKFDQRCLKHKERISLRRMIDLRFVIIRFCQSCGIVLSPKSIRNISSTFQFASVDILDVIPKVKYAPILDFAYGRNYLKQAELCDNYDNKDSYLSWAVEKLAASYGSYPKSDDFKYYYARALFLRYQFNPKQYCNLEFVQESFNKRISQQEKQGEAILDYITVVLWRATPLVNESNSLDYQIYKLVGSNYHLFLKENIETLWNQCKNTIKKLISTVKRWHKSNNFTPALIFLKFWKKYITDFSLLLTLAEITLDNKYFEKAKRIDESRFENYLKEVYDHISKDHNVGEYHLIIAKKLFSLYPTNKYVLKSLIYLTFPSESGWTSIINHSLESCWFYIQIYLRESPVNFWIWFNSIHFNTAVGSILQKEISIFCIFFNPELWKLFVILEENHRFMDYCKNCVEQITHFFKLIKSGQFERNTKWLDDWFKDTTYLLSIILYQFPFFFAHVQGLLDVLSEGFTDYCYALTEVLINLWGICTFDLEAFKKKYRPPMDAIHSTLLTHQDGHIIYLPMITPFEGVMNGHLALKDLIDIKDGQIHPSMEEFKDILLVKHNKDSIWEIIFAFAEAGYFSSLVELISWLEHQKTSQLFALFKILLDKIHVVNPHLKSLTSAILRAGSSKSDSWICESWTYTYQTNNTASACFLLEFPSFTDYLDKEIDYHPIFSSKRFLKILIPKLSTKFNSRKWLLEHFVKLGVGVQKTIYNDLMKLSNLAEWVSFCNEQLLPLTIQMKCSSFFFEITKSLHFQPNTPIKATLNKKPFVGSLASFILCADYEMSHILLEHHHLNLSIPIKLGDEPDVLLYPTILHFLISIGNFSTALLIISKCDLTLVDNMGRNYLHYSVLHEKEDFVKLFVDVMDVNSLDNEFNSPLDIAKSKGNDSLAKLLIERNADVSHLNQIGMIPLSTRTNPPLSKIIQTITRENPVTEKQPPSPLYQALSIGNLAIVSKLISLKADVNSHNQDGESPLHVAIRHNNPKLIELLIKNGAQVDVTDKDMMTPLQKTASLGYIEAANVLIINKASVTRQTGVGDNILHIAVQNGQSRFLDWILNREDAKGFSSTLINLKNQLEESPLHISTKLDQLKCTNVLLEHNAYVNCTDHNGRTPLYYSITNSNVEATTNLLQRKADIHMGAVKETPVFLAFSKGNPNIIRVISERFLNITFLWSRMTPLHWVAHHGLLEFVKLFLGRDPSLLNEVDETGKTALHYATIEGHSVVAQYLLREGAERNITDKEGKTPHDWATLKKSPQSLKMILEGAEDNNEQMIRSNPKRNARKKITFSDETVTAPPFQFHL